MKTFRIESEKLFKSIFPKQQVMASKFNTRTLPLFAEQVSEDKIEFRWTIQEDYEKLNLSKLAKLQEVRLAGDGNLGLTGIQLVFTEGIASPLFECSERLAAVSHKVHQTKQISLITVKEFTSNDASTKYLPKITILDESNATIVDGKEYNSKGGDKTQKLSENEAIIGLYGVKDKYNNIEYPHISSLGFIVCDTSCFK